jgi:hypothetical protein
MVRLRPIMARGSKNDSLGGVLYGKDKELEHKEP